MRLSWRHTGYVLEALGFITGVSFFWFSDRLHGIAAAVQAAFGAYILAWTAHVRLVLIEDKRTREQMDKIMNEAGGVIHVPEPSDEKWT